MEKFILLFRGINVGGNNILPMKQLVGLLQSAGFNTVSSYIQSGNIVLQSQNNPLEKVKKIVAENFGFSPSIFLFTEEEFLRNSVQNPFSDHEPKSVHLYFCDTRISVNIDLLNKYIAETENYSVIDNVFYLYAPQGIGRSKLVKNIAQCLSQTTTGRNLNTVNKLKHMLSQIE
ncbi:DUF1697 domain-containing protein [Pseudoalteromonas sp. MMG010]|uniref:DUF1697 domain-containing protein n=1 Tax=Pseudoalteromonas sp. MMG010 TaxID=2822685 RepID=UPI001B3A4260|nr:DUF1697 domain-containing protein [Pseudoalteromonas sp. MMG010]MBQ4833388.1 DUF1697 domain-containing protein [Pseudoalteromonas sp. MMG010]